VKVPLPGGKELGLSGGLYNRVTASVTKFMEIPFLPKLTDKKVWIDRKVGNTCDSFPGHLRCNCNGTLYLLFALDLQV
jgi:hypothetical protein